MRRTLIRRGGLTATCVVLALSAVSADDLSRYREFALGNSVATVTAITRTGDRDLKTVHSRPALLQQVEWRPRYMTGAPAEDRDSINEMVFSFVDDRLFKMSVAYDRERTKGLTNQDMIASLTEIYGAAAARSVPSARQADSLDTPLVLAEWRNGDAQVALQHSQYNESFSLVITSLSLDTLARKAQATAVVLDAREAPAREAALVKVRADEARQAEEQAREANKKVFRP